MTVSIEHLTDHDLRSQHDRARLLYDEFGNNAHGYGTWGAGNVLSQNILSPEEVQREQEGLDKITNSATEYVSHYSLLIWLYQSKPSTDKSLVFYVHSKIVEIFPHGHSTLSMSASSQLHGSSHQDILLSLIPGDKSKRSIRIYPVSRPTSKDAQSLRSHGSFRGLNGTGGSKLKDSSVLVKLDVNWPE